MSAFILDEHRYLLHTYHRDKPGYPDQEPFSLRYWTNPESTILD